MDPKGVTVSVKGRRKGKKRRSHGRKTATTRSGKERLMLDGGFREIEGREKRSGEGKRVPLRCQAQSRCRGCICMGG